ncbi:hypothetical protein FDO65_10115 [Nakamurella flava]|uniref:DUF7426 domain-containing protein n=1 Tax=Nakamurella flava TaxID=2576308 RepID=A0A4U6QN93_9ACTN|nr:hypothetical protein [Nakamurella flava]TKV61869.1 hypothetical protein FDO65_10115 [Nakamurella flava]
MPDFGAPVAAAADDLVLHFPGRDGQVREYRIPPCTAGELFDLLALDRVWTAIGKQRLLRLAKAPASEVAATVTEDVGLRQRIERLMNGPLSAEDMLALPLGPVAEQMLADGVSKPHYLLASATAQHWHISGEEVALEIYKTGVVPVGKPGARPAKNSRRTGSGPAPRKASSRRTSSPRKSSSG